MFYHFRQNNSGGYWVGPINVIVEANSPAEANEIASTVGPCYFDGDGDCSCCGNRWSELWENEEGSESPEVWGEPADENNKDTLIIRKVSVPVNFTI